jgi:hypothetical protein
MRAFVLLPVLVHCASVSRVSVDPDALPSAVSSLQAVEQGTTMTLPSNQEPFRVRPENESAIHVELWQGCIFSVPA